MSKHEIPIRAEDTLTGKWNLKALDQELATVAFSSAFFGVKAHGVVGAARFKEEPTGADADLVAQVVAAHDGAPPPAPAPLSKDDDATHGAFATKIQIVGQNAHVCMDATPGAARWKKIT